MEGLKPALLFMGFMGAGKSTALKAAADQGLETVETDALIEQEVGDIEAYFEQHGEAEFREQEAKVILPLLERAEGQAIALGGGSVLNPAIQEAMARHVVVWLEIEVDEAWRRAKGTDRPLARDHDAFVALYPKREPLYESLADAVVPAGDRGQIRRAMPFLAALLDLPAETKLVWVEVKSGGYPVVIAEDLLSAGWWPLESRRFAITDSQVGPLYAERIEPLAGKVEVEAGEQAKTLAEADRVLSSLADQEMTRSDHVVALGGGVVGDLAGFCAHTYQRGVPVVQVPTTLVGQVDSAIGGKTGVDLPSAKNYVGAYHQPAAVLSDLSTLASLPDEEFAAGWVEVIKTALLAGGPLWAGVRAAQAGELRNQTWVVFACARYKAEVVAADERDAGRRAVLNLGHTVGHAIEAATGYGRYRHGEAVGLGLLAALRISDAGELRDEVKDLLSSAKLPTSLDPEIDVDAVLEAVERDKKRDAEGVKFVLLSEPGAPREGQLVDRDRVRQAVEELTE